MKLSGTSLSALETCPLRWFLQHEVHADTPASAAMSFGGVLHALAHEVGDGQVAADLDVLMKRLDTVWDQLAYDAPWQSDQQRDAAREALERFLAGTPPIGAGSWSPPRSASSCRCRSRGATC